MKLTPTEIAYINPTICLCMCTSRRGQCSISRRGVASVASTTSSFLTILTEKDLTSIEFGFMKVSEGLASIPSILVLDDPTSFATTRRSIHQNIGSRHFSRLTHMILEILPRRFITQVSHKDTAGNGILLCFVGLMLTLRTTSVPSYLSSTTKAYCNILQNNNNMR